MRRYVPRRARISLVLRACEMKGQRGAHTHCPLTADYFVHLFLLPLMARTSPTGKRIGHERRVVEKRPGASARASASLAERVQSTVTRRLQRFHKL